MKRIGVHLEDQQPVYLFEDVSVEDALDRAQISELLAFFKYNLEHPETRVPYVKFPSKFIYEKKQWRIRKQGSNTIGRVQSIHPSAGEVFYLRMLLVDIVFNQSAGKTSFGDLRTVNGVEYGTFKETCRALGLLDDDELWNLVMEDAKNEKMPKQMRVLFVMLLAEVGLSDAKALFEKYHEAMSEDFENQVLPPDNGNQELLKWMLLIDIEGRLQVKGKEELFSEIGIITTEMRNRVAVARRQRSLFYECREVREEIGYDRESMR